MEPFVSTGVDGRGVFVIDDDGVCIDGWFFKFSEIKSLKLTEMQSDSLLLKGILTFNVSKETFEGYHLANKEQFKACRDACNHAKDIVDSRNKERASIKEFLFLILSLILPIVTIILCSFASIGHFVVFIVIYVIAFLGAASVMGPSTTKRRRTSQDIADYGVDRQGCIGGCLVAPIAAIVMLFESIGDVFSAIGSSAKIVSKGDTKQITKFFLVAYIGALVFFCLVMVWPK